MNRWILSAALLAAVTAPAVAQMDSMTLAHELGSVLAAEEFCGLTYNQDAIAAFIEEKVSEDDMGFNGNLNMFTSGVGYEQQNMGASQKTAHCKQTARVAKSYGFTD